MELPYVAEPPHGDSQHKAVFKGWALPGLVWGSGVAWSPCSRYCTVDWLSHRGAIERRCIVVDVESQATFTLPEYVTISRFKYPQMYKRVGAREELAFEFSGRERWSPVAA
jgi:hypothetical protein